MNLLKILLVTNYTLIPMMSARVYIITRTPFAQVTVVGVLERFYRTISSSHVTDLTEISMENLDKLISVVSSRFEVGT